MRKTKDIVGYELEHCIIEGTIKSYKRELDKNLICRCKVCGRRFIRGRRYLFLKYSHCGCLTNENKLNVKMSEYEMRNLDLLSKKMLGLKIDALGNPELSKVYNLLYYNNHIACEYLAMDNFMSYSTLLRRRNDILNIWNKVRSSYIMPAEQLENDTVTRHPKII